MKSKMELKYTLGYSFDELTLIANDIDKYYRPYEKKELKKNGKLKIRNIEPSIEPLKSIQRKIKDKILKPIPLPDNIFGGVKGKSNIANAKVHQGKKFHLCTDLTSFFPSISYKLVFKMFRSFDFSTDIASLLTKLTTYKGHVPQGAPTSTHIANLVFLPIDLQLINECEQSNIYYTRFIDDLSLSSQKDFKSKAGQLLEIVYCQFRISNRKTVYSDKPVEITGIVPKQNSIDVNNKFKNKDISTLSENSIKGRQNYYNQVKKYKKSHIKPSL